MTNYAFPKLPDLSIKNEEDSENLEATLVLEDHGIGIVKCFNKPKETHFTHKDSMDTDIINEETQQVQFENQKTVRRISIKSHSQYPNNGPQGIISLKKCEISPPKKLPELQNDENFDTLLNEENFNPFGIIKSTKLNINSKASRNIALILPIQNYVCTLVFFVLC